MEGRGRDRGRWAVRRSALDGRASLRIEVVSLECAEAARTRRSGRKGGELGWSRSEGSDIGARVNDDGACIECREDIQLLDPLRTLRPSASEALRASPAPAPPNPNPIPRVLFPNATCSGTSPRFDAALSGRGRGGGRVVALRMVELGRLRTDLPSTFVDAVGCEGWFDPHAGREDVGVGGRAKTGVSGLEVDAEREESRDGGRTGMALLPPIDMRIDERDGGLVLVVLVVVLVVADSDPPADLAGRAYVSAPYWLLRFDVLIPSIPLELADVLIPNELLPILAVLRCAASV